MKNLASQTFFCGLVPGLSVFFKSKISIGSWLGVRVFEPDSADIPELLCLFPLVTALFFLPSCAFVLKYEVFCRPL